VIQSDGKIVIGGVFTTVGGLGRNRIARLNSDGTLDATFNANSNNAVYAIALQSDGRMVV
jgi:trimeric autotransporter adhesin